MALSWSYQLYQGLAKQKIATIVNENQENLFTTEKVIVILYFILTGLK
jgi:hypothetical protein